MSESGSGPVLIIQNNIENVCFGAAAGVKLSCHAGVAALSDISNSENMNVDLVSTTMKRPLPNDDDDELIEFSGTKKVKLIQEKEDDSSNGVVNGNHCEEEENKIVKKPEDVTEESANGLEKSEDDIVKTYGVCHSKNSVEKSNNVDLGEDSTLESKIAADVEFVEANREINSETNVQNKDNTVNGISEVPALSSLNKVSNTSQEKEDSCIEKPVNVEIEVNGSELTRAEHDGAESVSSEAPIVEESQVVDKVFITDVEIKRNSIDKPADSSEKDIDSNNEPSVSKNDIENNLSVAPILKTKVADELSNVSKETKENSIDEPALSSEYKSDSNSESSVLKNETVEDNISEAPTLKVDVSDELVNINEKIDLCDNNSNSNNVDIKLCLDKTASVNVTENSTNPPKTETTHVEVNSYVEVDEMSPVNNVGDKGAMSSDLVNNIQDKERSSSDTSLLTKDNIKPRDEINDKLNSEKEEQLINPREDRKNDKNGDDSIHEKIERLNPEECAESKYSERTENKSEENLKQESLDEEIKNVLLDVIDPLDVRIKIEEPEIKDEPIKSEHQIVTEEPTDSKKINSNVDSKIPAIEIENSIYEGVTGSANEAPSSTNESILDINESKDTAENSKTLPCAEAIRSKEEIEEKMVTDENGETTPRGEASDEPASKKLKLDLPCEKDLENSYITEELKEPDPISSEILVETISTPKSTDKPEDIEAVREIVNTDDESNSLSSAKENDETLESTPINEKDKIVHSNESIKTTDVNNTDASNATEANVDKDIHDSENKSQTISVNIVEENPEESEKGGPDIDASIPETSTKNTDISNESKEKSNKQNIESKMEAESELETKEKDISAKIVEKEEENKDEPARETDVVETNKYDQILKSVEGVDSDIEIVDDSNNIGVHQSKYIVDESTAEDNQEKTGSSKDKTDLLDREEGDLMIDEGEPDSDIELITDDIVAAEADKENAESQKDSSETSQSHSSVTAMDVDEVQVAIETENNESKSKADSPTETDTPEIATPDVDVNEKDEANTEKKDVDDDEIIFIKECKKASDCTCVMCYKNKTPDKRDTEDKEKTDAKDKIEQKSKKEEKSEKKDKSKRPKLTEKLDHLTRKDLEKLVTRMFVKAYGYESALGSLREMVVKAQSETKTIQGMLAVQGKQLKELGAIHEKAVAELRTFQEDPARQGTLHPLKITRNVGLQVNVASATEKKRLTQASTKSSPTSPALTTRSALNAKLKRPITRPAGYTGGPSPQLVHAGSAARLRAQASPTGASLTSPSGSPQAASPGSAPPVRRGVATTTPRPGRPPVRSMAPGGLRVLPPRALNSAGLRSPSVSPRQSSMGRLVPRSPLATSTTAAGKTSGGSVDIINLDDDETSVQATKNNSKVTVRSPTNTLARNPSTTIRLSNSPSNGSGSKPGQPQRVFVPSSQGYKIRTPVNSSAAGTVLTSLPNTTSATTYVLNTTAGPIPFQTNNIRLNFRPNAANSHVRLNYQGHPAPVPPTPKVPNLPTEAMYRTVPGAPKLRVQLAQEGKGIQLTWSLDTPSDMAGIESYQLYAYQENKAAPINAALWKNIGKLDALPLPMACTLTQFTSGHTYHFLVRAVDVFKRFSAFSNPGTIHLRT